MTTLMRRAHILFDDAGPSKARQFLVQHGYSRLRAWFIVRGWM